MREKALPSLHGAVESFQENIIGVIDLLALPYVLIDMGLDVSARLLVEAIANARATAIGVSSEERRAFVDDVTHKLAEESCTDEGHREEHRTRVHGVLASICQGSRGKSGSQALLQAGLVRVWSSLESLAEDLWELSLNTSIDQLGIAAAERVLGDQELQKRNVEGLLAQSIQLHVLARHGWNISGKLGTLLKVKCDFTSVQGINRAFAAVFKDRTPVPQLGKIQELREIELLRHLVAHRAGIVDEAYRGVSKRNVQLGSRLELTSDEVINAANLIIEEARDLWSAVQSALPSFPSAPELRGV